MLRLVNARLPGIARENPRSARVRSNKSICGKGVFNVYDIGDFSHLGYVDLNDVEAYPLFAALAIETDKFLRCANYILALGLIDGVAWSAVGGIVLRRASLYLDEHQSVRILCDYVYLAAAGVVITGDCRKPDALQMLARRLLADHSDSYVLRGLVGVRGFLYKKLFKEHFCYLPQIMYQEI